MPLSFSSPRCLTEIASPCTTSAGRSSTPISSPRQSTRLRSSAFFNSRTLPGQSYFSNAAIAARLDRKSTRLNSSHGYISYAVFCLKKKKEEGYALQVLDEQ